MEPTAEVTVGGRRPLSVPTDPERVDGLPLETTTFSIRCATGEHERGRWLGVPIADVLEAADVAPTTTHLLATAADGHRACLELRPALSGLLGLRREDVPGDTPRLLADVAGARTVRRVVDLEPRRLSPVEDPTELETVG
ncbi:molybdopterin-binding protein [Natronorarus salvus]|uniref:hypothetical protein n=1 Tax=Natronorarus salvus TaxID=3117733 RepID=UPI002F26B06B